MTERYFIYARKSSDDDTKQVMSIPDQLREIEALVKKRGLTVIDTLFESRSAKRPGRPVFNQMIARIRRGEARGIICWKVNRLARNMTDGGVIADLLSDGVLQHVLSLHDGEFFPHTPIMLISSYFSIGSQYSKDLRTDTMRGQRTKIREGWCPRKAPPGYRNVERWQNGELKRIIDIDEVWFPRIRQYWTMFLSERFSLTDIWLLAQGMGLMGQKKKQRSISFTAFRNIFKNIFYTGQFRWNGEVYPGKHKPMVTENEYRQAQKLLKRCVRDSTPRHDFLFRGLLTCGACGAKITAEKHVKPNGKSYTYYRCTRYRYTDCGQKMIPESVLSSQFDRYMRRGCTIKEMKSGGSKFLLLDGKLTRVQRRVQHPGRDLNPRPPA